MAVFTSTLPDYLLELLDKKSKELALPKNKLIERALKIYLEQLNKAEYRKSYQNMSSDVDVMQIAEEGMADYLKQLDNL